MKILLLLSLYSFIWCQTEVGSENTLDIMTWNLKEFPYNGTVTVDYVDDLITSSNLDIIALQEISSSYYFDELINDLNDSESQYSWQGYRDENGTWSLAYIINTSTVTISLAPSTILNNYSYYFAGREPYVVIITYFNEQYFIINNHYKAYHESEDVHRRQQASIYLKHYIDTYLSDENVIVLGDLNDEITDSEENNVFLNFLSDPDEYLFVDMEIAQGSPEYWSYPTYSTSGSHIDHILITDELFNHVSDIQTVLYDLDNDGDSDLDDWYTYYNYITDHRPVHISLCATGCDMEIVDDTKIFNPQDYIILNTYPNPFNPSTNITVNISWGGQVYIHIFNIAGQVIARLGGDYLTPGTYQYIWHANNLPSGIYIVRAELNNKISMIKKIIKLN